MKRNERKEKKRERKSKEYKINEKKRCYACKSLEEKLFRWQKANPFPARFSWEFRRGLARGEI